MLHNFEYFGLNVELFIIVFSFLCWLITPATEVAVVKKPQAIADSCDVLEYPSWWFERCCLIDQKQYYDDSLNNESARDFSEHYLKHADEIIDALSMNEARKVITQLKKLEMVNQDIGLAGKGINKKFLLTIIKSVAIQSRETVANVLREIFDQTS